MLFSHLPLFGSFSAPLVSAWPSTCPRPSVWRLADSNLSLRTSSRLSASQEARMNELKMG
jgi:hypothetical protein